MPLWSREAISTMSLEGVISIRQTVSSSRAVIEASTYSPSPQARPLKTTIETRPRSGFKPMAVVATIFKMEISLNREWPDTYILTIQ